MTRIRSLWWRARDERGAGSVEFVMLFPVFMLIFFVAFESAMLLTRQLMLERALDVVMRDVRLSTNETFPLPILRRAVCERARILPDCDRNLSLEFVAVSKADYAVPNTAQRCVDRGAALRPLSTRPTVGADSLMLVRACFSIDPFFPNVGLGLRLVSGPDGEIRIATASAFVQEPELRMTGTGR
ncbi:pilus assembly protein [Jannaschia sp. LMIT008]|uniref:TadE/TadG family type IV pilus assembly protein n=1 Tax=Jannaschia maritima TaxID=3032585 RepID=UPI002810A357|nr:pilus assembly protein [Jannaschia sp. LMIT008]